MQKHRVDLEVQPPPKASRPARLVGFNTLPEPCGHSRPVASQRNPCLKSAWCFWSFHPKFFPNVTVRTSLLGRICTAVHPTQRGSSFAGVRHFVRQLREKKRISRSKLDRRGPSLPLNFMERLSALLRSGIQAESQLFIFLNCARFKTQP